jgi:GxxExxY protein
LVGVYLADLLYKDEVYAIVGVAMEVHKVLGCGFLEGIYQEALEIELSARQIPFTQQQELIVHYKAHLLKRTYIADFVVFDKIIVEIKSIGNLTSIEESQLLNYLKATGFELGLLINFGSEKLQWKRMINTKKKITELREIRSN